MSSQMRKLSDVIRLFKILLLFETLLLMLGAIGVVSTLLFLFSGGGFFTLSSFLSLSPWILAGVVILHRWLRERYRPEARALREAIVSPGDDEYTPELPRAIARYYKVSSPLEIHSRRGSNILAFVVFFLCVLSALQWFVLFRGPVISSLSVM